MFLIYYSARFMGSEGNNPIFLLNKYRVNSLIILRLMWHLVQRKMHCLEYLTFYIIKSCNGLKFNIKHKSKNRISRLLKTFIILFSCLVIRIYWQQNYLRKYK